MANEEHLKILKSGIDNWNQWRLDNPNIQPDLSNASFYGYEFRGGWYMKAGGGLTRAPNFNSADLSGANLSRVNLGDAWMSGATLYKTNLQGASLKGADLVKANLTYSNLIDADFSNAYLNGANFQHTKLQGAKFYRTSLDGTDFRYADIHEADLQGAFLYHTNMSDADLTGANLKHAHLVETNLQNATLTSCHVYGISAWNLNLEKANQTNLVITDDNEPTITVDNIEVAQFIYLLLHNEKIRGVIDTITSKAVLILGRFTPERKVVLDTIRNELRQHNYLPILFDFDKPSSRDLTETISTLAHISRFIIADITEAKSIPQELKRIVPNLPSVPVQPILANSAREYAMFEHFKRYPWVLDEYEYETVEALIADLETKIIVSIERKAKELSKSP